ncbi:STN domain-containing protein [Pseudomonas palmensis]|uniref:STN domain-containing protein n=1 Tax=Pseudomonas palmensis TaxID=2815362 RepID=UPI0039ECF5A2
MRHCLARIAVLLLAVLAMPVHGAGPIRFNIPAQPLDEALHAFGQQSGMAVLVDRELTARQRSMPLNGAFSARDGLRRLLEGTGLMARYSGAEAFTVQRVALPAAAPNPRATGGAGNYARTLQRAVEQALCASALARPGHYRAAVQVWIDARGVLAQSRLLASTGDHRRDSALVESLRALRLERPPPSALAQPVTLLLLPDTRMDCP